MRCCSKFHRMFSIVVFYICPFQHESNYCMTFFLLHFNWIGWIAHCWCLLLHFYCYCSQIISICIDKYDLPNGCLPCKIVNRFARKILQKKRNFPHTWFQWATNQTSAHTNGQCKNRIPIPMNENPLNVLFLFLKLYRLYLNFLGVKLLFITWFFSH